MKKLIALLCLIGSFAVFAQSQPINPNGDKPLQKTQFRKASEDVVNALNVALKHPEQMKELLDDYRDISVVTFNIEPSNDDNFSDKEVFIFDSANCSGMVGRCFSEARVTIKRFFNKNIMDDTPWIYDVGEVKVKNN